MGPDETYFDMWEFINSESERLIWVNDHILGCEAPDFVKAHVAGETDTVPPNHVRLLKRDNPRLVHVVGPLNALTMFQSLYCGNALWNLTRASIGHGIIDNPRGWRHDVSHFLWACGFN